MRTNRQPGTDGKLPPVGNTVDIANATWTNTIGASGADLSLARPRLRFDAAGFLLLARTGDTYIRAGLPTMRKRFGTQPLPGTTMFLQERAYTSPIW